MGRAIIWRKTYPREDILLENALKQTARMFLNSKLAGLSGKDDNC